MLRSSFDITVSSGGSLTRTPYHAARRLVSNVPHHGTIDKVDKYHEYTDIPLPHNLKGEAKKAGNGECDRVIRQVNVDEEDDSDEDNEDNDDEDEELREEKLNLVVHMSTKIGKARTVSRWLRSLVNHMDGLSIASLYYGKHANGSPIHYCQVR